MDLIWHLARLKAHGRLWMLYVLDQGLGLYQQLHVLHLSRDTLDEPRSIGMRSRLSHNVLKSLGPLFHNYLVFVERSVILSNAFGSIGIKFFHSSPERSGVLWRFCSTLIMCSEGSFVEAKVVVRESFRRSIMWVSNDFRELRIPISSSSS